LDCLRVDHQCDRETDRQTDGQTDRITIAIACKEKMVHGKRLF